MVEQLGQQHPQYGVPQKFKPLVIVTVDPVRFMQMGSMCKRAQKEGPVFEPMPQNRFKLL